MQECQEVDEQIGNHSLLRAGGGAFIQGGGTLHQFPERREILGVLKHMLHWRAQ